jgi:ComEC/Rec2-related protein
MGMVLGRTAGLSADTERQFQAGGVFHLVVVSGFNIAIVAAAATWIGRFIARRRGTRLVLTFIAVAAYTLLVGWQMPVVRAAIMACAFIVGRALDRGHSPLNAAALSAFVLLLIEPLAIEDQSFQMTFAAVVAVIGIGVPAIEWVFARWNLRLRQFDSIDRDGLLDADIADWRVSRRMWCELYGIPRVFMTAPIRGIQILCEALIATIGVEAVFIYFMVESFHRMAPVSPLLCSGRIDRGGNYASGVASDRLAARGRDACGMGNTPADAHSVMDFADMSCHTTRVVSSAFGAFRIVGAVWDGSSTGRRCNSSEIEIALRCRGRPCGWNSRRDGNGRFFTETAAGRRDYVSRRGSGRLHTGGTS